jgi:hypothetical protein
MKVGCTMGPEPESSGSVEYPTPEMLPGSPLGELSYLIGYRDYVYAAVGHCLTHLVLHGGPCARTTRATCSFLNA